MIGSGVKDQLSTTDIVRAVLAGELGAEALSALVLARWERGEFVDYVDPVKLPEINAEGPGVARYEGAESVRHWRLYGAPGAVGCVLVDCPHDAGYRGDLRELLVPPHVHPTDHVAVVLRGGGRFVVARTFGGSLRLVVAEARPGMIAFYPSGVAHTFIVGPGGILVASAQSEFQLPDEKTFAAPAGDSLLRAAPIAHEALRQRA